MIPILTSITLENLCQSLKFIYLELCSMYCVWPHILNLMFMKFIDVTTYNSSLYIFTVTCYLILAKNTIYYIMVDGCLVCFLALALQHCSACLQYFFLFFFFFSYWKTFLLLLFLFYPGHWMRWCSVPLPSMSLLMAFHPPRPFFVPLSPILVSDMSLRKTFIGVLNIEMYSKHTE